MQQKIYVSLGTLGYLLQLQPNDPILSFI